MSAHLIEESQQPRVILSSDDARRLRAKAVEMKRHNLSAKYHAEKSIEAADEFIRLMDVLLKSETK